MEDFLTKSHGGYHLEETIRSSHGSPSGRTQARRRSARPAAKHMSKSAFGDDILHETEDEDEADDDSSLVDERIRDLEVSGPSSDEIGEISRLSPRRRAMNRDRSIMLREIYKAPTPSQTKLGIVYNCYKKDMESIHESGEHFFGALKAETLAKTMLRSQNVHVIKCSQCAAGHIEYFQVIRVYILSVVNVMETILQADAYVLIKALGWILSDAWHQFLDTFSDTAFLQKMVSTAR
ncbi:hypothetical protein EV126DRAFT_386026 [Verticillium dahliae]|nr:hypothetical protein EV126DRAFT_386026 [Verticillium dahliae]